MKKNVNVFIAVLLVAVLCGGVIWLQTADEEKLGWNIHDSYGDTPSYSGGAAYTNATFAGPSAGEGGVMPLSSSSTLRARTSYSYAGAYGGASSSPIAYSQSPIANSLTASAPSGAGLYTTSSQTFNSYGGGGNGGAATGGSVRGGVSTSQPAVGGSIAYASSPISYTSSRRQAMPSSGDNPAMMAAENPVMAMTNAASAGMDNGFYGGYTAMDYSGSANYGQYTGMFGGGSRMGVRGKQNALGFNDSWWKWFDTWVRNNGDSYYDDETKGYYFDRYSLESVYNAFLANFWNSGMGEEPSFDEWLDWYQEAMNNSNGYYDYYYGDELYNRYYWVPVGDILPLLLIALLYLVFVAIKSKSLKSLLKTERSE
ncbi:MAG: hypothetical protein E7075_07305 [Bacteroidales bacterium]|nr:hypothetical protein [Bacteroidales bacterium]